MRCTRPALEVAGPVAARQGAPPVVCRPATSKQSFHPHTVPARGPDVLSAGGAAGQRASTLARAVGVELPDGAEVSELTRQLEGTLDALDDSAGGHHGVE